MLEFFDSRRERMALGGLSLAMLMSSLDTSIANASLPVLAAAFGATFQHAQWIVLAYLLAVTSLTVGAGRLGDIVGRRSLLLTGVALFTVTSMLCAAAPTLWVLVIGRAIQGVFAATMMALAVAMIGDTVPKARAGRAMGQLAAMSAVGTTVGPAIGGLLHGPVPTVIFLVNVPLGVLAFALLRRYLPAQPPRASRPVPFDAAGTLLLALTLVSYALSMTLGRGHWSALNVTLLGAALCGAIAFVFTELHAPAPLVPIAMFRNRTFSISLGANTAVATVMMATLIVGPFYLSRTLALNATRVGILLSLGPMAAAITAALTGRLVGRFGESHTALAGLSAIALGALALALLPASTGVVGYMAPLITMTSGYAAFQTANNTSVMAGVDDARRGVVAGLLGLSRNLGLITGASVMGAVFFAAGMHATFAVAAVLIASVLTVTFVNPKEK